LPIRLAPTPTMGRVRPFAGIEFGERRRLRTASNAEQRAEGVERVEAAIESKRELVEIGLQMLGTDVVVDAVEPGLQIAENQMDHRQEILRHFGVAALGDGVMIVSAPTQAAIGAPIVGNDQRPRHHSDFHEAAKRVGAAIGGNRQPDATGVTAILPLVLSGAGLPVADLDSTGDQRLVVDATPLATRPATKTQVSSTSTCLAGLSTDAILIGSDHPGAQLVKNAEGGFVSAQAELALELNRRYARRLAGDQVGRLEPYRQRRVALLHHRSGGQADIFAAGAAAQHAGTVREAEGLSDVATPRADEALRPAGLFQIGGAGCIVGKEVLELGKRARERQIVARQHIDDEGHDEPQPASVMHSCASAADAVATVDPRGDIRNRYPRFVPRATTKPRLAHCAPTQGQPMLWASASSLAIPRSISDKAPC